MRSKLIGLFFLSFILAVSPVVTAHAADDAAAADDTPTTAGCDPAVSKAMADKAQASFDNWNKTFSQLVPKPSSAASSNCISRIANVFDIGSLTGGQTLAELGSGVLTSLMGSLGSMLGIPDLGSSPTLSMNVSKKFSSMASDYFNKFLNKAVCQEAYAGMQRAFRQVSVATGGKVNVGPAAAIAGLGKLAGKWDSLTNPDAASVIDFVTK